MLGGVIKGRHLPPQLSAMAQSSRPILDIIVRRLCVGLLTLWAVSVLIFASTEVLPGDVAGAILGRNKTPEAELAIREALGLDRPAPVRYVNWLTDFVQGDIGRSMVNDRDMGPEIRQRLGNTLFLAGIAACVS